MANKDTKIISAGNFSSWLEQTEETLLLNKTAKVPCGDCRACCTSSYFIHIKPDEKNTLATIPKELLFKAPGLPKGHVLMGYDEKGHCPMFINNNCSIYKNRPQTCRNYDCRIFAATGLSEDEKKPLIREQANRWQFSLSSEQDPKNITAVKMAAEFLNKHPELFPEGFIPINSTQQAVLAIKVYKVFLEQPENFITKATHDQLQKISKMIISTLEQFDQEIHQK